MASHIPPDASCPTESAKKAQEEAFRLLFIVLGAWAEPGSIPGGTTEYLSCKEIF
jgi:hypothetical protein